MQTVSARIKAEQNNWKWVTSKENSKNVIRVVCRCAAGQNYELFTENKV
jgi:hypothetical protein